MKEKRIIRIGIVVGALLCILLVVLIFKVSHLEQLKKAQHSDIIAQQEALKEAERKRGLMDVMSQLLGSIENELDQNPGRNLSDETISRIADISQAFFPIPYNYVENDSLPHEELSQERGQLLLTLLRFDLDSTTLEKIKLKTSFAKAYLEGANLENADLSNANLVGAHLKNANLKGAILDDADLRGANLWGVNMENASIKRTAMNRADMRWANLNGANMEQAELKGIQLAGTKLKGASMVESIIHYAFLNTAILKDVDLSGADLFGTDLRRANFNGANLSGCDLRDLDMSEATFEGSDLAGVRFRNTGVYQENWIDLLENWKVIGADEIKSKYRVEKNKSDDPKYVIQENEN